MLELTKHRLKTLFITICDICSYLSDIKDELQLINTKLDEMKIIKAVEAGTEQKTIDEAFKLKNGLYSFKKQKIVE